MSLMMSYVLPVPGMPSIKQSEWLLVALLNALD
jgi:hypothetical protein